MCLPGSPFDAAFECVHPVLEPRTSRCMDPCVYCTNTLNEDATSPMCVWCGECCPRGLSLDLQKLCVPVLQVHLNFKKTLIPTGQVVKRKEEDW